jgi:hypothetical protein
MTKSTHAETLDALRAELLQHLRAAWAQRQPHTRDFCSMAWSCSAGEIVALVARVRAIDAVRANLRDRKYMAELWMLIACGKTREEAAMEARAVLASRPEIESV